MLTEETAGGLLEQPNATNDAGAFPANTQEEDVPAEAVPDNESSKLLTDILLKLDELKSTFERKIERDTHKDQLFDNMHRELIGFQNNMYEKPVNSLALDLIQIIDYMKKDCARYAEGECTAERYQKLLKCLSDIVQELEDALYRHEIEPYQVAGDAVDTKRQKIISVVEIDDANLGGTIAQRLAVGYEKNGKVLRPERIKAYKYTAHSCAETSERSNEDGENTWN